MVTIRLHNSLTRKKEIFQPLDPSDLRMYVCGPTVYDRAHLGNARPVVVFDVLFRLLRHVYGEEAVTYVRNFTDVDDKINARAAETGRPIGAITDETIAWYHQDMDALGALRPTHEPRATAYIAQMIAMIEMLIAKGHAYEVAGHVLFKVRSYPEYGKLSGRSIDDMIAGARVEVAPHKDDPMDFVLWKPSDPSLPGWESPWGRGRPGWHIECSAMAHDLLGASFDIHGGGLDLQFPHHENEIAQSCCAFPDAGFARYWLHNEMVQVEGKKMSKSLGNFFTVLDLLFAEGVPGEIIRFVLLTTHYRKPIDWSFSKAKAAEKTLRKWHYISLRAKPSKVVPEEFLKVLSDDLNTPGAISLLHRYAKEGNGADLLVCANLLGLLEPKISLWFDPDDYQKLDEDYRVFEITTIRHQARAQGRYDISDRLREGLIEAGVAVYDNKLSGGAFRELDALLKHALSKAEKAHIEGEHKKVNYYIELLQAAGFSIHLDSDGPSAVTDFDGTKHEEYFERKIQKLRIDADRALEEMQHSQ